MSDGAELRPLRKEDAEEVAALYQSAFGDERPMDAQEIVEWFSNAEIKEEWLRVLEIDGRVVGYGDILIEEDEMALDVAAPGHWDPFFDWAEGQARANKLARVRAYSPPDTSSPGSWRAWDIGTGGQRSRCRSISTMPRQRQSRSPQVWRYAPTFQRMPNV